MTWKTLAIKDLDKLVKAREQLHQAAQIAAAVGRTYLPKVKDDSFANFGWNRELNILQGHTIETANFSAGLEIKQLSIHLIKSNQASASYCLDGKTQKQALIWMEEQLVNLGLDGSILAIKIPYDIPVYPTSKGKPFELYDEEAFAELSSYFSNAHYVLQEMVNSEPQASDIRCWPHHFDLGALITLQDTGDPETSTSIGVGLSPGDEQYNEPYFYLTPWPYPPPDKLPDVGGPGHWHTDNWVGGVLLASQILKEGSSKSQEEAVRKFLSGRIDILKSLLNY